MSQFRADNNRILVVGTTPDYIAYIHENYHGRALFLTDTSQQNGFGDIRPDDTSQIIVSLSDKEQTYRHLVQHIKSWHQRLIGVTCYDCEWLELTATLAGRLGLPYSSSESVRLSRNKLLTKQRWAEQNVPCPRVAQISTETEADRFVASLGRPVVLKPLTGTGSELTFRCNSGRETVKAFQDIMDGLRQREQSPLYLSDSDTDSPDPKSIVLAEELVEGDEFSADFIIDGDDICLIRVASKLRDDSLSFGTILAYAVPARLPRELSRKTLAEKLRLASQALGFTKAICMVDFIVNGGKLTFLELTPRVGGDCLPPLIRQSCGLDTIALALDFAEEREFSVPDKEFWDYLAGLRLFAPSAGILNQVQTHELPKDPRVREIHMTHPLGHQITLPPDDYNSWMLGYVIFEPDNGSDLMEQCKDLRDRMTFIIE